MARTQVFISYAHRDKHYFDQFRTYLEPWRSDGRLDVWNDERLEACEDWDAAIQSAIESAAVAVLLVSPAFLASCYIRERELPALLRAREEGQLALAPLFVRASAVNEDDCAFPVPLSDGRELRVKLTRYEGLNKLDQVVESRKGHHRNELYVQAAGAVRRLYRQHAEAREPRRPGPEESYPLAVELNRAGDFLVRRYHSLHARIPESRSPWEPLRRRLEGWRTEVQRAPSDGELDDSELGDSLYAALFGTAEEGRDTGILRAVFQQSGGPDPRPIRHPVRVRIETGEPLLAELPWSRTSWQGRELWPLGWTFELVGPGWAAGAADLPDALLKAPCSTVMIAPGAGADAHFMAFQDLLGRAWTFYRGKPELVADWRSLEEFVHRRRPRIAYYFGPAERRGAELVLPLRGPGEPDRRTLAELIGLWGDHPPQVVFLNLLGEGLPAPGLAAGAASAVPGVPLIVVQTPLGADEAPSRRAALEWFHELLTTGPDVDPVWALHRRGLPTATAWGHFGRWSTRTSSEPSRERIAHLLIDRKLQKSLVRNAVDELVHGADRKLCCLVGFGDGEDGVAHFADQLEDHLRRFAGDVAIVQRLVLRLPLRLGEFNEHQVEQQVRRDLALDPRTPIERALAARKPQRTGRARPVLLLDWQVRGGSHGSSLVSGALEAWVSFCCQKLATRCPDDLRLLSCLALESAQDRHAAIVQVVHELRHAERFRDRAFRLLSLPRLGTVEPDDLADFLSTTGNTSCPDELAPLMPELVLARTKGRFEPTVELIERAEITSWYDLHDELAAGPDAPAGSPLRKDVPL